MSTTIHLHRLAATEVKIVGGDYPRTGSICVQTKDLREAVIFTGAPAELLSLADQIADAAEEIRRQVNGKQRELRAVAP